MTLTITANQDKTISRRWLVARLYGLATAMALVGLFACLLFLVAGLQLGPDQLAEFALNTLWVAPLALVLILVLGLAMSYRLFVLLGKLDRGEHLEKQEAERLWDLSMRFPVRAMLISMACWILGATLVVLLLIDARIVTMESGLMAGLGTALIGMTTSLGFALKSRDHARRMLEIAGTYLPHDFKPLMHSSLNRKVFASFMLVVVTFITALAFQSWTWRDRGKAETALATAYQTIDEVREEFAGGETSVLWPKDHGVYVLRPFVLRINGDLVAGELTPSEKEFVLDHQRLLGRSDWEMKGPWRAHLTSLIENLVPLPDAAFYNTADAIPGQDKWLVVQREPLSGGRHPGAVVEWKGMTEKQEYWAEMSFYLLILFMVTAFAIAGMWSLWLSRDVSDPTEMLRKRILVIAGSEKPGYAPILSDDEIGDLAAAFNSMSRSLENRINETAQLMEAIGASANQLAGVMEDMVDITSDQAAGASQQAAGIQQITTTSEEIAATLKTIAGNSKSVEDVAGQTLSICREGQGRLSDVAGAMQGAIARAGDVGDKMLIFQEQANRIEEVLDFIKDVSEKTNLIALNASIEASAAGQQGDRFSIIATEMRKLAEQTMNGADEITRIFEDLQSATSSAIIATEEGQKQVGIAQKISDDASDSFQNIVHWAGETARSAQEISMSSHEQTSATEHLASALSEINDVAAKFAQGTKLLEASVTELEGVSARMRELLATDEDQRPERIESND